MQKHNSWAGAWRQSWMWKRLGRQINTNTTMSACIHNMCRYMIYIFIYDIHMYVVCRYVACIAVVYCIHMWKQRLTVINMWKHYVFSAIYVNMYVWMCVAWSWGRHRINVLRLHVIHGYCRHILLNNVADIYIFSYIHMVCNQLCTCAAHKSRCKTRIRHIQLWLHD